MLRIHLSKQFYTRSFLFVCGAVLSFLGLYYFNSAYKIQKVLVVGSISNEKKVIETFFIKRNIIFLQNKEIINHISTRFPQLIIRNIEKQYPNVLILYLAVEKPFAFLKTDGGYLSVSQKGIVLQKERTTKVPDPIINFYQPIRHTEYQVGQVVSYSKLQKTLIFIQALIVEGYQVETVAIDSVDMIACKTRGFTVVFSQKRDTELQKYELRQLVKQLKIGALRVKRLDLRFDKPVVELQTP